MSRYVTPAGTDLDDDAAGDGVARADDAARAVTDAATLHRLRLEQKVARMHCVCLLNATISP